MRNFWNRTWLVTMFALSVPLFVQGCEDDDDDAGDAVEETTDDITDGVDETTEDITDSWGTAGELGE